jgi:cysteine desulfuration protein SufE
MATTLDDIREEYEFLDDKFDRYELLIKIGRELEPMPDALRTDTTLVRGCVSKVWTYPVQNADGTLHFLADSNSAITKGIIALLLMTVQDKHPQAVLDVDIEARLKPFEVERHLSSNRLSGIPNMIALIRETAARYADA